MVPHAAVAEAESTAWNQSISMVMTRWPEAFLLQAFAVVEKQVEEEWMSTLRVLASNTNSRSKKKARRLSVAGSSEYPQPRPLQRPFRQRVFSEHTVQA